jgi:hypothetical protein
MGIAGAGDDSTLLDRIGNRITVGMIGEYLGTTAAGVRLENSNGQSRFGPVKARSRLRFRIRFVVISLNGESVVVSTDGNDRHTLHRSMIRGKGHTDLHTAVDILNGFRSEYVRSQLFN